MQSPGLVIDISVRLSLIFFFLIHPFHRVKRSQPQPGTTRRQHLVQEVRAGPPAVRPLSQGSWGKHRDCKLDWWEGRGGSCHWGCEGRLVPGCFGSSLSSPFVFRGWGRAPVQPQGALGEVPRNVSRAGFWGAKAGAGSRHLWPRGPGSSV